MPELAPMRFLWILPSLLPFGSRPFHPGRCERLVSPHARRVDPLGKRRAWEGKTAVPVDGVHDENLLMVSMRRRLEHDVKLLAVVV